MATGGVAVSNEDGTWSSPHLRTTTAMSASPMSSLMVKAAMHSASTLTLAAVNDAPERTAGDVNILAVLEDSGTTSLGLSGLEYSPGGGNDELAQTLNYSITALPDNSSAW